MLETEHKKIQRKLSGSIAEVKRTEQIIIDLYRYIEKLSPITSTELLKYIYPLTYQKKCYRDIRDKVVCLEQLGLITITKKPKFAENHQNSKLKYYQYEFRKI